MGENTATPSPDIDDGLAALAETLSCHQIRYAVIGAMAAGYRSEGRNTEDIDLMLSVPQIKLPALLEALKEQGFELDLMATIREWTQHHMVKLLFRGIDVDWLKPVVPLHEHILDRATEENWLNRPIRVATSEGLILLKLLAYRTKDLADIESLVVAHAGKLDTDWIRSEWQTVAALDDPRMIRFSEFAAGQRKSMTSPI